MRKAPGPRAGHTAGAIESVADRMLTHAAEVTFDGESLHLLSVLPCCSPWKAAGAARGQTVCVRRVGRAGSSVAVKSATAGDDEPCVDIVVSRALSADGTKEEHQHRPGHF